MLGSYPLTIIRGKRTLTANHTEGPGGCGNTPGAMATTSGGSDVQDSNRRSTDELAELREQVTELQDQVDALRRRLADGMSGTIRAGGIEITDHRGTVRLVIGCVDKCSTPADQDEADNRFGIHMNNGRGLPASWWTSDDDAANLTFSHRGNTVLNIDPRWGVMRWTDFGSSRITADDGGE